MSKKIIYILSIISIILLVFFIVTTYAKYSSESGKNVSFNLTKWKLLINDTDIANNSNFSSAIVPISTSTAYISNGVVAPGYTGYFDVEIDCTNTNLSFEYSLTVSNADSEIVDFTITGYSIDNFDTILPYNNSIAGQVLYNSENKINSTVIRIYVTWDDSQTNTSNNATDTSLSINDAVASLDLSLSLTQKIDTYDF